MEFLPALMKLSCLDEGQIQQWDAVRLGGFFIFNPF